MVDTARLADAWRRAGDALVAVAGTFRSNGSPSETVVELRAAAIRFTELADIIDDEYWGREGS